MSKLYILSVITAVSLLTIGCQSNSVDTEMLAETTPIAEPTPVTDSNEEYKRSINDIDDASSVSVAVFEADKKDILDRIDKLSVIMANYDYDSWLNYIEPDSIDYWSNQKNLYKASKMLPGQKQKLTTLDDYFRFVFIPSRKNGKVDEIRYISKDWVKAVQVRKTLDDNKNEMSLDVIYYNFRRIGGRWLVRIPPLES